MRDRGLRGWHVCAATFAIGACLFSFDLSGAAAGDRGAASIERAKPSAGSTNADLSQTAKPRRAAKRSSLWGKRISAFKPVVRVSKPAPPIGLPPDPADESILVVRGRALSGPLGPTSSSQRSGGVGLGGNCDCDSDCAAASGQCKIIRCNTNICEEKNAPPGTACDDADGLFCTRAECGSATDVGVCVPLWDNPNGAAGVGNRLDTCPGECLGGGSNGFDCASHTDCPSGQCRLRSGALCNEPDDRCELVSGLGRCCLTDIVDDSLCSYVTETTCSTTKMCDNGGTCLDNSDCDSDLGRCTDDSICTLGGQPCGDASACDITGDEANDCSATLAGGRFWLRIADPDDLLHACYCPIYSSGVAPLDDLSAATDMGTVVRPAFACQGSITANDNPLLECESVHAGRDCPRRCSGGGDDNDFCTVDSDCDSVCALDICVDVLTNCHGLENLGDDYSVPGGSHLRLTEFRFAGGVDTPGDSLRFDFWDDSDPPKLVRAFITADFEDSGNRLRTFTLDCFPHCSNDEQPPESPNLVPFIIPSSGFVTMSSILAPGGTRDGNPASGHWLATDNVQVGSNNPDLLWKNDVRDDSDPLTTKRLIFELVGEVIDEVSGACCDVVTPGECDDTVEWACRNCQQDSGPPIAPGTVCNEGVDCERGNRCLDDDWQGPETKAELDGGLGQDCASDVCDSGTCCLAGGLCIVTDSVDCANQGGEFGTTGADCTSNCCDQDTLTGGDCCEDTFLCTNGGSSGPNGTCSTSADCDDDLGRCTDSPDLVCSVSQQTCLDESACVNTGANANTCELCAGATVIDAPVPSYLDGSGPDNPTTITVDITGDNTSGQFGIEQGDLCSSGARDAGWYEKFKIKGQCEAFPFDGSIVTGECDFVEDCGAEEQCIGNCAIVTISMCCSTPLISPIFIIVRDVTAGCGCGSENPTFGPLSNPDGTIRGGFGALCDHEEGPSNQPCCADGNYSIQFNLPSGEYLYQISRGRACQNSLDACDIDDDCNGVPCEANGSQYQVHLAFSPCFPAACCVVLPCETNQDCIDAMGIDDATCDTQNEVCNSGCLQRNLLECEDRLGDIGTGLDGTWLGNLNEKYALANIAECGSEEANNVCKTGACCLGPGACDDINNTTSSCLNADPDNIYVGNLACDLNPCPICTVTGPGFCQEFTEAARFITIADRSTTPPIFGADNFTPTEAFIDEICADPSFVQILPDTVECSLPGEPPPDDWQIRIFDDAFGLPGVEVGVAGGQTLEVLAKEPEGGNSRVWHYSFKVPDPIPVTQGECHWFEITGFGEGNEGCLTLLGESVLGDGQSLGDDGSGYGPEDVTVSRGLAFATPLSTPADIAICLSGGISGTACGETPFAPCVRYGTGAPVCADESYLDCIDQSDDASGYIFVGQPSCAAIATPCAVPTDLDDNQNCTPPIPANDDCATGTQIIAVSNDCKEAGDCEATFDTRGGSTDGPKRSCYGLGDGGGTDADNDFVHDIWYSYTPTCSGVLTMDTCNSNYATQLALYDGNDDTCECPPTDASLITCDGGNDNDNEFGVNDPDNLEPNFCPDPFLQPVNFTFSPGSVIRQNVLANRCYLVRVGGFRGANQARWGEGELHLRMECSSVEPVAKAPAPHDILKNKFISFQSGNAVPIAVKVELLDWACSATFLQCSSDAECKACTGGDNAGIPCTVANQCPGGSCDQTVETCEEQSPPIMLGWVGVPYEPDDIRVPAGTWSATVDKVMPPLDLFPDAVIHLGDCEIAPAEVYGLSASPDGNSFAPVVAFRTIVQPQDKFWGDMVGNFTGVIWTPPNNLVNVDDINGIIKFLTLKPAPHMTRVDLGPETPNFLINVSDLGLAIASFKVSTYPPPANSHQGPVEDCP